MQALNVLAWLIEIDISHRTVLLKAVFAISGVPRSRLIPNETDALLPYTFHYVIFKGWRKGGRVVNCLLLLKKL
jgi:hypothetical protein